MRISCGKKKKQTRGEKQLCSTVRKNNIIVTFATQNVSDGSVRRKIEILLVRAEII